MGARSTVPRLSRIIPRTTSRGVRTAASELRKREVASLLAFDAVVLQVANDDPESYERMRHRHTNMQ
ncbi:hypothetical protein ABIE00_000220 [Arthrobacter sp. OAP107]